MSGRAPMLHAPPAALTRLLPCHLLLLLLLSATAAARPTARWASPEWHFLGPFPVGKTEFDGDPVAAPPYRDALLALDDADFDFGVDGAAAPEAAAALFSETVQGGRVPGWAPLRAPSGRRIRPGQHQHVNANTYAASVDLNGLIQKSSSVTIQEFQGYVTRTFRVKVDGVEKPPTFSIACTGLHTVMVDGRPYQSDVYASGQLFIVLPRLRPGLHRVTSRIRGKGSATFRCEINGPHSRGDLRVFAPPQDERPDILRGNVATPYLSLAVANMGDGDVTLDDNSFHARIVSVGGKRVNAPTANGVTVRVAAAAASAATPSFTVRVSQTLAVPLHIDLHEDLLTGVIKQSQEMNDCVIIEISVRGDATAAAQVSLRCRHTKQSHIFTFLSHDGTVASAAVLMPRKNACPAPSGCPIVLALSGVGVKPSSMADSFKYKRREKDADFTFGFNSAWVLAPERDGAHNMEGTGHWTMRSAVRALSALVAPDAGHYSTVVAGNGRRADPRRLVYTGHSRGGHGALLFATHLPDLSCGVFASNGWIRREYYADANPIFDHDLQLSHGGPEMIRRVFESAIAENDVSLSAGNMLGMPALLRSSAFDGTVSPFFMRRMARIVKSLERSVLPAALSSNLELNEFTGDRSKSHWWWDTQRPNDGGVMFDRKVRKFISRALRSCHRAGTGNDGAAVGSAAAFESVSLNPATFSGNHGVRVVQFDVPFRYARVRGERQTHKGGWIFRTSNALRFECTPSPRTEGKYLLPRAVDNTTFSPEELEQAVVAAVESTSRSVTFAKHVETGVWRIVSPSEPHHTTTGRGIETSGPMRQVFDRNSAVIVPAGDDDAMSLAVLLANSHFAASRTTLPIVVEPQDAESPSSLMAKYAHLNLIFIGRSALRNVIVNDLSPPAFPFRLRESGFTFHGRVHTNAAAAFIVPWQSDRVLQRYDRLALVLTEEASGTRESPLLDLMASHTYSSNTPLTRSMFTNMVPDWIVTDGDEFLWKGLGGLSAAGYFSHRDWSADRVMSVF